MPFADEIAAIDHQARTLVLRHLDVIHDFFAMFTGHQRAHFEAGIEAGADAQRFDARLQDIDQLVGNFVADADTDRDCHAAFAGGTVGRAHERVGDVFEVGIGQDQHVILGAAHGLAALAVGGGGGVDVFRDRGRANETDRLDARVVQQCIDRFLVTVDHVEHARRSAGFDKQFGQAQRTGRILFRRLQHHGVTGNQRHARHPQRNHRRKVERRDAGDHAEWLAHRIDIDTARDVVGKLALLRVRRAAGEFRDFDAAQYRSHGVLDDLAVLG